MTKRGWRAWSGAVIVAGVGVFGLATFELLAQGNAPAFELDPSWG